MKTKLMTIAEHEIGIKEFDGFVNNKRILEYLSTVDGNFQQDEINWCSAFVNWCVKRCGYKGTDAANARSWLKWGDHVNEKDIQVGDIVIFWRESPKSWKGHVGFYAGDKWRFVQILGGNQNDEVKVSYYKKSKILGIRRPCMKKEKTIQN